MNEFCAAEGRRFKVKRQTKNQQDFKISEISSAILSSGLSLLYQYFPSRVVHLGLVIKAGTRDEDAALMGTAHCLEHMLFKGTKHRKAFHILTALDKYGGELNAYTTREFTAYYASVSVEYAPRAMELLADMYHNASLPEKELIKEKSIIADEIDMYADTPDERIQDEMQELLFPGHSLGFNILGTRETLSQISSQSLQLFQKKHYQPAKTALFFSGGLAPELVKNWAEGYFPLGESAIPDSSEVSPVFSSVFEKFVEIPFQQSHCIMAAPAYEHGHPLKPALALLTNMLGGPAMNSRLNIGIREKYGFTYQIEAGYQAYRDCGVFNIYFATEPGRLDKTRSLVLETVIKMLETLNEKQLSAGKLQFIGQMQLAEENRQGLMLGLSNQMLDRQKIDTITEAENRIKMITLDDVLMVAEDVLNPRHYRTLIYKGTK